MITITKRQAGQFILAKQGLIGKYRFSGKNGAYGYVRQAGCIQYDPVDDSVITVNASSYTIITAHKEKK